MKNKWSNLWFFSILLVVRLSKVHGFSTKTTKNENIQASTLTNNRERSPLSVDDFRSLNRCKTGVEAQNVFANLDNLSRFNSIYIPRGATEVSISDGDLAVQTGIRGRPISELVETNGNREADRASLFLFCVFVASSTSSIVVNNNLPGPEILRFVIVWLLSFAPLAFVGAGLAIPDKLQEILIMIQRYIFPSYRKRMIQHEAGHFLIAYMLGMPIKSYQANAIRNAVEFYPLANQNAGTEMASLLGFDAQKVNVDNVMEDDSIYENAPDVPFFAEGGRGDQLLERSVFRDPKDRFSMSKLPTKDEPKSVWPFRGFDMELIDKLAVISLAGVCSEILAYGNAEGGFADLSQLRQFFNSAQGDLSEKEMENRVKYSISFGISQLKLNLGVLDDLVEAMERDLSVADCCYVIEKSKNMGVISVGEYEIQRREKLKGETNFFERIIFNTGQFEEGEGLGLRLQGDDPFYIAIGLASIFFVWASNGGLSL